MIIVVARSALADHHVLSVDAVTFKMECSGQRTTINHYCRW